MRGSLPGSGKKSVPSRPTGDRADKRRVCALAPYASYISVDVSFKILAEHRVVGRGRSRSLAILILLLQARASRRAAYARKKAEALMKHPILPRPNPSAISLPTELPHDLIECAFLSLHHAPSRYESQAPDQAPSPASDFGVHGESEVGRPAHCDVSKDRRCRARMCPQGRMDELREMGRAILSTTLEEWHNVQDPTWETELSCLGLFARRIYALWEDLHLLEEEDTPRTLLHLQELERILRLDAWVLQGLRLAWWVGDVASESHREVGDRGWQYKSPIDKS
ncbi:hypothetical protein OBBRIDRAFT_828897 [Obba rivulosa]|uniref:Uncharacterized protein n=1 Tax=Obba rivulosa TaxID=1052685 RepID=A0A8E2DF14_9APHY|nr:hypothetical protein OBBRIDRAFT_828897 [Obba rivulosa]